MSSTDMSTMSALRRRIAPTTPIANSTAARIRKWAIVMLPKISLMVPLRRRGLDRSRLGLHLVAGVREDQRADDGDEEDERDGLEREQIAREQDRAHRLRRAEIGRRGDEAGL